MRIGVWHNLPSGGGMRALHDHLAGLLRRGHQVLVWSPPSTGPSLLGLPEGVELRTIPIDAPPLPRNLNLLGETRRFLKALNRHCAIVAREMDESGCDVLFAGACKATRTPPLALHAKIPSAIYLGEPYRPLYEAMPDNPWRDPGISPLRSPLRWWEDVSRLRAMRLQVAQEIRSAKAFDRILVNSRFTREFVLRAYGLEATVCLLGVDAARFAVQAHHGNHVVGVGAFVPEKNIELVIDAVGALPADKPDLVWVGNVAQTSYLESLRTRAQDRGVRFVPKIAISESELVETLRTARCMVYAPRLEPFGYAPLEAGACGIPVVGIAEGGLRESVESGVTGLLVDGGFRELSKALESVLGDQNLASRLGAAGREAVLGKWSLEASIGRLEANLEDLRSSRCVS